MRIGNEVFDPTDQRGPVKIVLFLRFVIRLAFLVFPITEIDGGITVVMDSIRDSLRSACRIFYKFFP